MKNFFTFSLGYFAFGVAVVLLTRESGVLPLQWAWASTVRLVPIFARIVVILLVIGLVIAYLTRVKSMRSMVIAVSLAFLATIIFQSAFSLIKTSLPYIVPFYADPFFAQLDQALHGGVDPWVLAHRIAEYLPMDRIVPIYLTGWALPAICLPVFVAAVDNDPARIQRFVILYVVAWAVVGNIFALIGMSAGPVYYDRLFVGERFAGLTEILLTSGLKEGQLGRIQEGLWLVYSENGQAVGSGISAFPSVHLSISTVAGLYLAERSRWLAPLGALFVATILFLSVYTGYHYAVDGYFSILFICLVWYILRRRNGASKPSDAVSELTAGSRVG